MSAHGNLQIFVEAFFGQLFRDVDTKHVDADAGEGTSPTVSQEQLVFGTAHGGWPGDRCSWRRCSCPWRPRSRVVGRCFGFFHLLVEPEKLVPHVRKEQLVDFVQHVALEDVVHDLMSRQASAVHQQLEGELQPGIHLPSTGLAFAFFSSSLRFDRVGRSHSESIRRFFKIQIHVAKTRKKQILGLRLKLEKKVAAIKNDKMCQTTNCFSAWVPFERGSD